MIAGSQSRWVKQQEYFFNPIGLRVGEANNYGSVDAAGKIVGLRNNSHKNRSTNLENNVSNVPSLAVDYWGVENAISFGGETYMDTTLSEIINWDDEFYVAFAFERGTSNNNECIVWIGDFLTNVYGGVHILLDSNGELILDICTHWPNEFQTLKGNATINTFDDGIKHVAICYFSGTNDVNDWKIYVDGLEESTTILFNDDFTGRNIVETGKQCKFRLGRRDHTITNFFFSGKLGKCVVGFGNPDIEMLTKNLQ